MIEMNSVTLWLAAQFFAAAYCIARAGFDFRKGHAVWGVLGVAAGLAILLSPIPTHAVSEAAPQSAAPSAG